MNILINDLMQFSTLPDDLKSPSLADRVPNTGIIPVSFNIPSSYSLSITIDGVLSMPYNYNFDGVLSMPYNYNFDGVPSQPVASVGENSIDCIGIGGTDATQVIINGSIYVNSVNGAFEDGLYILGQTISAGNLTIEHNGTYMGRIAMGQCRKMCISPSREIGWYTSVRDRESLSGQVIPSAGGYGGRRIAVDFRYKFTEDIIADFDNAYLSQIMKSFPFFIDFDSENWIPWREFYGKTDNNILLQSSINNLKYSKRLDFKQAF